MVRNSFRRGIHGIVPVLLLALVFLLTACGQSASPTDSVKTEKTSETTKEAAAELKFPLEKPVSLGVAYKKTPDVASFDTMPYFQELKKQSNVDIEWIDWAASAVDEKKQLAFASNDLPEVMINIVTEDDLMIFGSQGMILSIDGMLEKYAPNLSATLVKREDIKKVITLPDGHIYGLPFLNEQPVTSNCTFMVNTEWLDKTGMKIPETTEEFYQTLKALKGIDLNGNGKADEIPWSFITKEGSTHIAGLDSFMGAFGIATSNSQYAIHDGKVVFAPATEQYKQALIYLNRLYSEGLIDQEFATMDQAAFEAKCTGDPVKVAFTQYWAEDNFNNKYNKKVYTAIPPLKGPDGTTEWARRMMPPNIRQFVITSACKNPEIALMWGDLMQEPDMALQAVYGMFGEWLEKTADGKIKRKLTEQGKIPVAQDLAKTVPYFVGGIILQDMHELFIREIPDNKVDVCVPIYEPYLMKKEKVFPTAAVMTKEELESIATIETDINGFVTQSFVKFVTDGGVEAGWDAYIKKLKDMGFEKLLGVQQTVYERYSNVK